MKYVFLITFNNGQESRNGFFADTEKEARDAAEGWAGAGADVGICVEQWAIEAS